LTGLNWLIRSFDILAEMGVASQSPLSVDYVENKGQVSI
jgi:hypothetical protein